MLEQLMEMVRQSSQEAVINNPEIPNQHNDAVMQEAGSALMGTLQNMMANGQANDVLSLFGSNAANVDNSSVTQQAQAGFIDNISSKLGISPTIAKGIAAIVIPMLISKFIKRANDPSDNSIGIQDIFNTISGGSTSGLNLPNILSRFTQRQAQAAPAASANPMDRDGDGDVDLQDLIGAFAGGQAQPQGGGGLFDQIGKILGR